jgi:hypothetical protein
MFSHVKENDGYDYDVRSTLRETCVVYLLCFLCFFSPLFARTKYGTTTYVAQQFFLVSAALFNLILSLI